MPVSLSRIVIVVSLVSWTHPCAYVDAAVSVVLVTSVEGSSGRVIKTTVEGSTWLQAASLGDQVL